MQDILYPSPRILKRLNSSEAPVMILDPLTVVPPIGTVVPSCARDLASPVGNELDTVDVVFVRESSKASLRIPKYNFIKTRNRGHSYCPKIISLEVITEINIK